MDEAAAAKKITSVDDPRLLGQTKERQRGESFHNYLLSEKLASECRLVVSPFRLCESSNDCIPVW